ASLASFTAAARAEFAIGAADRVLQFASISFDTSVEEIWPCLTAGGTLVLRSAEMLRSSADFLAACQALRITLLDLPTAYWHGLVADLADQDLAWPPALTRVIVGGERVLPERVAAWRRLADGVRLWNTYGPTESTVTATLFDPASLPDRVDGVREVPIGRPIAGTRASVLDVRLVRLEPAPAPRAAIAAAPASPPSASCPIRSQKSLAPASTAPATWCAGCRPAIWSSSGAPTGR